MDYYTLLALGILQAEQDAGTYSDKTDEENYRARLDQLNYQIEILEAALKEEANSTLEKLLELKKRELEYLKTERKNQLEKQRAASKAAWERKRAEDDKRRKIITACIITMLVTFVAGIVVMLAVAC